jgi:hypothetical protein
MKQKLTKNAIDSGTTNVSSFCMFEQPTSRKFQLWSTASVSGDCLLMNRSNTLIEGQAQSAVNQLAASFTLRRCEARVPPNPSQGTTRLYRAATCILAQNPSRNFHWFTLAKRCADFPFYSSHRKPKFQPPLFSSAYQHACTEVRQYTQTQIHIHIDTQPPCESIPAGTITVSRKRPRGQPRGKEMPQLRRRRK